MTDIIERLNPNTIDLSQVPPYSPTGTQPTFSFLCESAYKSLPVNQAHVLPPDKKVILQRSSDGSITMNCGACNQYRFLEHVVPPPGWLGLCEAAIDRGFRGKLGEEIGGTKIYPTTFSTMAVPCPLWVAVQKHNSQPK